MTETKTVSENNGQYSRYLMDGEEVLKQARAKTKAHWGGGVVVNPVTVVRAIKTSFDAIKNNEAGSLPLYPTDRGVTEKGGVMNRGVLGFSCRTRAIDIVVTNYRMFFLYKKNSEPDTTYRSLSILYNPQVKPMLVEINKGRAEEREELEAQAQAGDKAAKKQARGNRSIMEKALGGTSHKHMLVQSADLLKRPAGWFEPKDVEMKGSKLTMELNWNNPTYMMNHLGATTIEAMESTMGSPFFGHKPFRMTLKVGKSDAQELYKLLRRESQ